MYEGGTIAVCPDPRVGPCRSGCIGSESRNDRPSAPSHSKPSPICSSLQLPAIGEPVHAGERFGEIESVKAVSELYCPVGGTIIEVHTAAASDLERLAREPYDFGWLIKIKIDDESHLAHLMTHDRYQKQIREAIGTP